MAIINGTPGGDFVFGTAGPDTVHGLGGADQVQGGDSSDWLFGDEGDDSLIGQNGADTLDGGDGDDQLSDDQGGDARMLGGAGNDVLEISRAVGSDPGRFVFFEDGGDGNDYVRATVTWPGTSAAATMLGGAGDDTFYTVGYVDATIDAGGGDDLILVADLRGSHMVTLGAGRDAVEIGLSDLPDGLLTLTDFQPGDTGETVKFWDLENHLTAWAQNNPFASGHLRLIQQGSTTILQMDKDGGADHFVDAIRFLNTNAAQFTAHNLSGWAPNGAPPPGETVIGTSGPDDYQGSIGADSFNGGAGDDVIIPGAGNDTVDGGPGDDILYLYAGDDVGHGGDGADYLTGGEHDQLFGDAGADTLGANLSLDLPGAATLDGGAGSDNLTFYFNPISASSGLGLGGDGADTLTSFGAGTATLDGGAGDDLFVLNGAGNHVTVIMGAGVDTVRPEPGEATLSAAIVRDFAPGGGGDHIDLTGYLERVATGWDQSTNPFRAGYLRLVNDAGGATLQVKAAGQWRDLAVLQGVSPASLTAENLGGYSPDGEPPPGVTRTGGAGADSLTGGIGPDTVLGLGGDDQLSGGRGDDQIDGGAANDRLEGDAGSDVLHGGDGADTVQDGSGRLDQLYGDAGDDVISVQRSAVADYGANLVLDGGAGDDRVVYGGYVDGQARLYGGDGQDSIEVFGFVFDGINRATVDAGAGDDQVSLGGVGVYQVTLGAGRDVIAVSSTFETGPGWPGATIVVADFRPGEDKLDEHGYSLSHHPATTGQVGLTAGYARLAQQGADVLVQNNQDGVGDDWITVVRLQNLDLRTISAGDVINDGFGPRWLLGGDGVDLMSPTPGFNFLDGGAGDDQINGGADNDGLQGGAGQDAVRGGLGDDTIGDGSGSNYLRGEEGNDSISGGIDFDDINGNMGNDTVHGGDGSDWAVGGKDQDLLFGDGGDDIVYGNLGNDTCDGGIGNDLIRGGQGDDTLTGGIGDDWMSGDRGDDTLTGGFGADLFHSFSGAGLDRVLDFSRAEGDRVQLDPGTTYVVNQVGTDTVIDMGGGDQLILVGVQASSLTGNWIFVG